MKRYVSDMYFLRIQTSEDERYFYKPVTREQAIRKARGLARMYYNRHGVAVKAYLCEVGTNRKFGNCDVYFYDIELDISKTHRVVLNSIDELRKVW